MNDVFGEPWMVRHTAYYSDPDAGPDALLNDATEWLQYAYNAIRVLAGMVREGGEVDAEHLPVMLEGIATFIDMGTRCAMLAHGRVQWLQLQHETTQPPA